MQQCPMSPLRQLCQPRHPLRIQIYVALLGAGLTGFAPSLPAQSDGYTMENAQLRVRLLPRVFLSSRRAGETQSIISRGARPPSPIS